MQGGAVIVEVKKSMHHAHWFSFSANGKKWGQETGLPLDAFLTPSKHVWK